MSLLRAWPQLVSLITKYLLLVSTCVTDYRWEVVARCQDDKQDIREETTENYKRREEVTPDISWQMETTGLYSYRVVLVIEAPTC